MKVSSRTRILRTPPLPSLPQPFKCPRGTSRRFESSCGNTSSSALFTVAAIALLANGFISLGFDTGFKWQWTVRFADQYDAIQIVLRAVYLLGALMGLTFFQIPRDNSAQLAKKPSTFSGSQLVNSKPEPRTSVLSLMGSSLKAFVGVRPSSPPVINDRRVTAGDREADSAPEVDGHRPQQLMVIDGSNMFHSTTQSDSVTFQLSGQETVPGVVVS